jgi:Tfp pilus assembly protein PilX
MIRFPRTKPKASERGVALIIALLTLLLITAALVGMIVASNTETNISANFRDEQTAFFAAKAGVEEIRDRLRPNATNSLASTVYFTTSPTPMPGAPDGVLYVTNPANGEVVAPWLTTGTNYPDDEICKEVTCTAGVPTGAWYVPAQSASLSYAAAPIITWKWVRIMVKPNKSDTGLTRVTSVDGALNNNHVCFNGSNEHVVTTTTCPDKPVYELTALAVTRSGSRRMIQYEVGQSTFPPIPGAIVFDGPTPDFTTNPNSAAFGLTGTDTAQGPNAGAGCPAANNVPALGGYNGAAATSLQGQVNRPGSYTGSPAGIADVSTQLGPLATVDGLQALVNSVTAAAGANVYPTNPSGVNLGTNAAPVVNVVQGDFTMGGGSSGAGILLVTGTLTMSGSPSFNGLILVIGKGVVQKNGGGNGTLNGSLFVANMNDASGNPIPMGSGNAPGIPTVAWNGGGNFTGQYDSCWINYVSQAFPYKTITDRELLY